MNKAGLISSIAVIGLVATLALAHGPKHNPVRHQFFMKNGIPDTYASAVNPMAANAGQAGKALYDENCASCHGKAGNGHGEAGADLDPKPPELKSMIGMPMASDGYLLWALSDGGEALDTAMPAFKDALSETERWQIIAYMQSGFAD